MTRMLSSTPVIVPPAVTAEGTVLPYPGWSRVKVVSLVPTTSQGVS